MEATGNNIKMAQKICMGEHKKITNKDDISTAKQAGVDQAYKYQSHVTAPTCC